MFLTFLLRGEVGDKRHGDGGGSNTSRNAVDEFGRFLSRFMDLRCLCDDGQNLQANSFSLSFYLTEKGDKVI